MLSVDNVFLCLISQGPSAKDLLRLFKEALVSLNLPF